MVKRDEGKGKKHCQKSLVKKKVKCLNYFYCKIIYVFS